jgi:hypothetical protein
MGRLLAIALLGAAVFAGSAFAGAKDPKKHYNAADLAWARSIRIHRSDLPGSGWKAERSSSDSDYAPEGCKNPDLSDLTETGEASNPDFTRGGSFIGSGSSIFATEQQATAAWARTSRIPLSRCLVGAMKDGMATSSAVLSVRSTSSLHPGLAPHEFGTRVSFRIAGPAAKVDGRISYYVFARGRAIGAVMVVSFGKPLQPVPLALEQQLTALVAGRLRR